MLVGIIPVSYTHLDVYKRQSYVVVDPKGSVMGQVGAFLERRGYQIKVFNSIDFSKSMHYNPLSLSLIHI